MKNIAKAIIQVMNEVKGMEKNSKVGTGNASYNGTKDQDVKEVFNNALSKNGLCILPIGVEEDTRIDRWEENTNYGAKQKQSVFTKVKTKYLLLHESGESVEIAGYGHGVDAQDKGAGKATTYALKNALLYTFLTPVGKIDDSDTTHSDDIETPKNKNNKNNQEQPKSEADLIKERLQSLDLFSHYMSFREYLNKARIKSVQDKKKFADAIRNYLLHDIKKKSSQDDYDLAHKQTKLTDLIEFYKLLEA